MKSYTWTKSFFNSRKVMEKPSNYFGAKFINYLNICIIEAYLEPSQTFKLQIFTKIVNSLKLLTFCCKMFYLRYLTGFSDNAFSLILSAMILAPKICQATPYLETHAKISRKRAFRSFLFGPYCDFHLLDWRHNSWCFAKTWWES